MRKREFRHGDQSEQIMCIFVWYVWAPTSLDIWLDLGGSRWLIQTSWQSHWFTVYFQLVHSNKLEFSMPSLILKASQPVITNIIHDQPLSCENHVHFVDMQRNIFLLHQNLRRSNGCKVQVLTLGHLVNCFLKLDDRMDKGVRWKLNNLHITRIHIFWNLNFQIWKSYAYSRGGQIYWPDNECLSQWFGVLPTPLEMNDPCNG